MFPIWVYFTVAFAIASIAFAIAQFADGLGTMFVIGATTMWAAFSAYHGARRR